VLWAIALVGSLFANPGSATPADADQFRYLSLRLGFLIGSASSCPDIPQTRILPTLNKFRDVIKDRFNDVDRQDLTEQLNRNADVGRQAIIDGKMTCEMAKRLLAELEGYVNPGQTPGSDRKGAIRPTVIASAADDTTATVGSSSARGVTDNEILFGIAAPFSGTSSELGRQMKVGIEAAFNKANDAGGLNGRMLRLVAADDGYEPTRTMDAMTHLYEKEEVFGYIGNVGTPTAVVAVPYANGHRTLFFGAFTGASILRQVPSHRYVFNYRASYVEETDAVVRYLLKIRHLQPQQIAVFAQEDAYGDAGFEGVAKAFRALGLNDAAIPRFNYKRNTLEVEQAIAALRAHKPAIKAVVMVASYRAAAKFIEKTRDLFPDMTYTNVSFVGSTELANELMLLGPRFARGVIVTQVVPAVGASSSAVLEYKNALAKYSPGDRPDYVSFEGYVAANLLIEAIKRVGPKINTEKLIDTLENMRDVDLGLGVPLNFTRSDHQASHKIWGTMIDQAGQFKAFDLE
jgi:ABC-type branched-subunit amino acid transport system substrate-binding protein